MPVLTPDTKEEQDQAYDPARETYDRKLSGSKTAGDLKERENSAGESAGDFEKWEREMAGGSSNNKPPTDNIDSAKSGEESGAWKNNTHAKPVRGERFGALLKRGMTKKGPIGVLSALILGGGGALGFFGFTLMPVTIMEHFTNDTNDLNNSNQYKAVNLFGKKLGGEPTKKLSVCNSLVSIRCQLDTLTEGRAKALEEKGFKLHDKEVKDGRVSFSALESPDGIVAHNAQELAAMLKNSAIANAAFNAAYSLKNAIFLLGGFFKNSLAKLNLTKLKKIEGDSKADADKSYEQATKGEKGTVSTSAVDAKTDENASEEEKKNAQSANEAGSETEKEVNKAIATGTKIQRLSLRVANALVVPQLMCLTFNMATYIAVAAKTKKLLYFAGFAMIFLTLASSIKANAATQAEVEKGMSVLAPGSYPAKVDDGSGNMVDNPNIGENALDAEAYKVVAYGDQINLLGLAKKFFIAGGIIGVIEKVLTWINNNVPGGKSTIKTTCKIVNSTVAQVISFLAAPILAAAFFAVTQILPIEEWAAQLVNMAIDAAAGPDLTTGVIGSDAGNVLFIGAAAIMGTSAQKFGMKPGALGAIRKNMAANHELLQREIAMKTHEASKTPFDVTNRYSFLGSMAFQLANFMPSLQKPVFSSMGKVLGAIPNSFNMLTKNASAAYSMPVSNYSDARFNQCDDEVYADIKQMTPDMFCTIRYVPFTFVDVDVVLDYMEKNNEINIDGSPKAGSHFEKYTKYCVNRTDPYGSSSVALEDQTDDINWYTGIKCMEDNVPNQMASEFTGYKVAQDTMDEKGSGPTQAISSGDAKELAKQVANNADIVFLNNATKVDLENFANTGEAINLCGNKFTIDAAMLGAMQHLSNKYKIYVNNIGFKSDRDADLCDKGQHPQGAAIDINRIDMKGGASTGMGLTFSASQVPIITAYANDWLASPSLMPSRGGVGQKGCGGFAVTPPPGATGINGNLHFADECNHLHIDARTR